jgi:hypothetical protein
MARKKERPSFEELLNNLRAKQFAVSQYAGVSGGMLVSKGDVAAVLVPGYTNDRWESGGARLAVTPGILVGGEIGRLLDRGYQKFIKTSKIEVPATAQNLQAIHAFEAELNQATGALGLYNESLGTTSDLYQYDRVRGREPETSAAVRPPELEGGH